MFNFKQIQWNNEKMESLVEALTRISVITIFDVTLALVYARRSYAV